jgi:hypothetical protein
MVSWISVFFSRLKLNHFFSNMKKRQEPTFETKRLFRLCVPKTLSALIGRRNHLTCVDHVWIVLLRPGRLGLAIQVEEQA